ncbi:abscission/NoCut checkpoint regulator-like isoform X2 [Gigantopelta aegis]|uniref:abscission/NoCut checkpoint regulator-like isoform X2 n=1 Tax=Gigantopelta aegis TaxID=1735272 RepID=UPI001B88ABE0|nr:abscission/NoCut checkpoint regulator-like isoform X2 [Gigantopelta aegis]XP_041351924.1 abscission/NoCut checkpoint regulator-like isoform X2 [Gigantopelta aegis]XP_041351925.1 abscission/NoCut checkpoint regulator-like isoform X2 [Gigantopelta aegis]
MASGQCYGCGASFGLFKKEHGCKNCGFAFCTKCLTKTVAIPKCDNTKHHVCIKCYDIITGKVDSSDKKERYSPPAAYLKRVAALEERKSEKTQSHGHASHKHVPIELRGLSKEDRQIAERLSKLKEKPQNAPKPATDKELSERLDRLKGTSSHQPTAQTSHTSKTQYYHPPERRAEQQQVDELLDEIANEVELDAQFDPVACVEKRLAEYKGQEGAKKGGNGLSNNLNKLTCGVEKPYDKNITALSASGENEVSLQEMNSLIEAAAQELQVDAEKALQGLQKDKELMDKLKEIKKRRTEASGEADRSLIANVDDANEDEDSEDEEQATKRILKKYLEEARLEEAVAADQKENPKVNNAVVKSKASTNRDENEDYEDPDELPYCSLCTEDATIRCLGCNYDLFCNKCFRWVKFHVCITYCLILMAIKKDEFLKLCPTLATRSPFL